MNDTDPQAIHVMQTVMSSGTVRFHVIFLKSLILHHFERGGPNAAPIHLHLLTDKASGYILEGILGSWRINKLRYTFYSAEPYYARVSWMKSNHYSGKVSTMKLYIPEILNSTVSKVILFDTDCLFMTDIVHLWNHFDHFKPLQFLGMAPEPFNVYYDLTEFGGGKQSFSYNGGVIMWNLQRLTMKKWEALYKPAYERALKVFTRLTAAEQTLMTVVIMENPEILYRLSCHWNFQLYEGVIPEECPSTWNRPPAPDLLDPLILHGDRYDKRELDFSLNEPKTLANHVDDLWHHYIVIRSRIIQLDGYAFRHEPLEAPQFSFLRHLEDLHPGGRIINEASLCQSNRASFTKYCNSTEGLNFVTNHRIHPLFYSSDYNVTTNPVKGTALVVALNVTDMLKLENLANMWKGWMSVAFHGTDRETISLLTFISRSKKIKSRKNILIHYVYKSEAYPESVTLHNVASLYSPTQSVLALLHNEVSPKQEKIVNIVEQKGNIKSIAFLEGTSGYACIVGDAGICAVKPEAVFGQMEELRDEMRGVLIPTGSALLPKEVEKSDRSTLLLALAANAASI
ncbi:unnamed protein product [Hymenolepis diminuta]|nr:unnamed protein product [Hymenolepis diminuta]VUZ48069.1 unnamed protein product [Hymenolepis diminuta]